MCQKLSKTHTFQFWGHFFGGGNNFFLSKVSEMNFYEHFKYVKARKNICQDVLASNGAKTWIIRASNVEIDFRGHSFGGRGFDCPPKVNI